jgi:hypothetical protein
LATARVAGGEIQAGGALRSGNIVVKGGREGRFCQSAWPRSAGRIAKPRKLQVSRCDPLYRVDEKVIAPPHRRATNKRPSRVERYGKRRTFPPLFRQTAASALPLHLSLRGHALGRTTSHEKVKSQMPVAPRGGRPLHVFARVGRAKRLSRRS